MSSTASKKYRRPPRSSPKRPRKRTTLSRAVVLREALALIDRDGLDRFSIRRLADHLGVTPMALYNHVSSKHELLQAVAERVVAEAEYRGPGANWQQVARGCFLTIRQACLAHPGAIVLVESAEQLPPAIFRPMEIVLQALETAGLNREDAVRAYFLLMTFTLGQMKYQLTGWSRALDRTAALRDGRISATEFPAVVKASREQRWDFEAFFEFGLSIILSGLDARIRPLN